MLRRIQTRFEKSPLLITILYIVILYSINANHPFDLHPPEPFRMKRDQEQKDYLLEEYQKQLMDYLFDDEKKEEAWRI